jgi:hypothetical protein
LIFRRLLIVGNNLYKIPSSLPTMTQQFYKLTPEELVRLRTEIARPTHREIFLYLMALCPFRDKSIDIDTQAIAEALGIHPKTVSKALRALADRGWIEMTITKATCSISRSEPNGSTPEPNGSTPEPNGSTPEPNGSTPEPNGSTPEPNGSTPEPNGSTYTPQSPSGQGFQKPLDLEDSKDSLDSSRPWRGEQGSGDLSDGFCEFVGGLYPFLKDNPRTKGRDYIIKLENSDDPIHHEKLRGYWADYQAKAAKAAGTHPQPLRPEDCPLPDPNNYDPWREIYGEGA